MQKDKPVNLIYIVGTSFSGSTLMSFLLGSIKEVFSLGEVKMFNRKVFKVCTCGQQSLSCPFWGKYYRMNYKAFDRHGPVKQLWSSLGILLGKKIPQNSLFNTDDYQFLKAIFEDVQKEDKTAKYLIDTSKNLWRLSHLLQCEGINVHIVYTQRELSATVASYNKRYRWGFLKGLLAYWSKNLLTKRFLKINNLDYMVVNNSDIRYRPEETMQKLGDFLEVDYSNFQEQIKDRVFHVRAGNSYTRDQFINGFKGIRKKDDWKRHLNRLQIKVLSFLE